MELMGRVSEPGAVRTMRTFLDSATFGGALMLYRSFRPVIEISGLCEEVGGGLGQVLAISGLCVELDDNPLSTRRGRGRAVSD